MGYRTIMGCSMLACAVGALVCMWMCVGEWETLTERVRWSGVYYCVFMQTKFVHSVYSLCKAYKSVQAHIQLIGASVFNNYAHVDLSIYARITLSLSVRFGCSKCSVLRRFLPRPTINQHAWTIAELEGNEWWQLLGNFFFIKVSFVALRTTTLLEWHRKCDERNSILISFSTFIWYAERQHDDHSP